MFLAAAALAQAVPVERWACVQTAYDGQPVTNQFVVEGEMLREGRYRWPYRIVHNTPTEIIATYPSVSTVDGRRVVNARTVVIDRITGDMIVSNIDLWASADENRPITGRCARVVGDDTDYPPRIR